MNPESNKFEELFPAPTTSAELDDLLLVRPNGEPVPKHWAVFSVGEQVVIKDYTFKVAYIGEGAILFEPVGVPVLKGPPRPQSLEDELRAELEAKRTAIEAELEKGGG